MSRALSNQTVLVGYFRRLRAVGFWSSPYPRYKFALRSKERSRDGPLKLFALTMPVDIDFRAIPFTNFTVTGGLEIMHDAFTKFPNAETAVELPGGGEN